MAPKTPHRTRTTGAAFIIAFRTVIESKRDRRGVPVRFRTNPLRMSPGNEPESPHDEAEPQHTQKSGDAIGTCNSTLAGTKRRALHRCRSHRPHSAHAAVACAAALTSPPDIDTMIGSRDPEDEQMTVLEFVRTIARADTSSANNDSLFSI